LASSLGPVRFHAASSGSRNVARVADRISRSPIYADLAALDYANLAEAEKCPGSAFR
jgi:hypothetical protein